MGSAYLVKDQENISAVTAAIFMKHEKDVWNLRWYSGWHIHPIRKATCPSEHVPRHKQAYTEKSTQPYLPDVQIFNFCFPLFYIGLPGYGSGYLPNQIPLPQYITYQ